MTIPVRARFFARTDTRVGRRPPSTAARVLLLCFSLAIVRLSAAMPIELPGPAGTQAFGTHVLVLANGNFVVTDPKYLNETGAVYLYRGDGRLVSRLTGSKTNDRVGRNGVLAVGDGNFLVISSSWNVGAGAVTWVDGSNGLSGVVDAGNSLVGSQSGDVVGAFGVTVLRNGNYVVRSPFWDNGTQMNVGAATFGNGNVGVRGPVSAVNSLIGTSVGDGIGYEGIVALANGHYAVCSMAWNDGSIFDVGAVTWGNGNSGSSGSVSAANSLVGSQSNDRVGRDCVTPLRNGNYVVPSWTWDNGSSADAGAVTLADGGVGLVGHVSIANSLVGTHAEDNIGSGGVVALSNGNYVVVSPFWDRGAVLNAGAVTFGSGDTGVVGAVDAGNSLVGAAVDDRVGFPGVTALGNGHYVVASHLWNNGSTSNAGAATWGNGASGISGTIGTDNSLVGNKPSDNVADGGVVALHNGNYVVVSYLWSNGMVAGAGAVTWSNGSIGSSGVVSAVNSIVGGQTSDHVGRGGVTALGNGHYYVASPDVDFQTTTDAGALTWGNGNGGTAVEVSVANSLIGLASGSLAQCTTLPLPDGPMLIACPDMQGDDAGAVSLINGSAASAGALIPTEWQGAAGYRMGDGGLGSIGDRYYVIYSPSWNFGSGAVSLGTVPGPGLQTATDDNSVIGATTSSSAGQTLVFDFSPSRADLIVGQPLANRISILNLTRLFADGFE